MVVIDRNKCCGCGHCIAIRMSLDLVKTKDNVEFYESPKEGTDQSFVERCMEECWSKCIYLD